jgi:carbamoyl-phosphate synthase large subunit
MKHTIIVTGTGSLIGQAVIKSLKKSELAAEIRIVGCDYFPNTAGSFWCDENHLLPDLLKKENSEKWKKAVVAMIEKEKAKMLFIGLDFELMPFADLKNEIESKTKCQVIVSNKTILEIGNDKYLTYKFLKENGLNYPKTFLPQELDFAKIEYPVILKPRVGARSKGVYIIKNKEDLLEKIKLVKEPIIQELIGDHQSEYTCGVLFMDGKIVDSIALRRDLKEGNTHIAEYKKNFSKKIYDYVEQIAMKLKPYGSCNFQLRLHKDGEPYLFEINPRCSGTTYIRSLFGFMEVEYIAKKILNYPTKSFELKEGLAYRYYEEKLA